MANFYPRPPRGGRRSFLSPSAWTWRFLSTPSARRATSRPHDPCPVWLYVYPRPPRGGRPDPGVHIEIGGYFYPRPPRGGRHDRPGPRVAIIKFLSTPSARRATKYRYLTFEDRKFLSTPSARRATPPSLLLSASRIFLSTPSARRAIDAGKATIMANLFLSTPSARRATTAPTSTTCSRTYFYPRPPRGGRRRRRQRFPDPVAISIHALREEGDAPQHGQG